MPKISRGADVKIADIPFTVTTSHNRKGPRRQEPLKKSITLEGNLKIEYTISPEIKWQDIRTYKNFQLSKADTFTVGDHVYVNHNSPPPDPPPSDATDKQLLQYDQLNFWVAGIVDIRAVDSVDIYLLVYWFYWPFDLPMGRQPYHASNELVISNHMDIIRAQSVSRRAELFYRDENAFDGSGQGINDGNLFWRQSLNIGWAGPKRFGGLSALQPQCSCEEPYNPDRMMLQCSAQGCAVWHHEQCLIDDVNKRAREFLKSDILTRLGTDGRSVEHELSNLTGNFAPIRILFNDQMNKTRRAPSVRGKSGSALPIKIVLYEETSHMAEVEYTNPRRQLLNSPSSRWIYALKCLCCGQDMR